MATNVPTNEAELSAFLAKAGDSFSEAQDALSTGLDIPVSYVLSNADLEVKAAVNLNAEGRTVLQTISAQQIRTGGIDPALLSTVRVSYTVTAQDSLQAAVDAPVLKQDEVAKGVRARPDVAALEDILGKLEIKADYVPGSGRWLVTARDPSGRLVRETIVRDEPKGGNSG